MLVRDIRDIAAIATETGGPALRYTPLAPAAHTIPPPPRITLGPVTPANLWALSQPETAAAGCYSLENATIAPTGVPIAGGVALHGEAFLHPRHLVVAISDRLNAADLPARHIDGKLAVLVGPAHETWGHWLTDFLPRLWVLQQAGHDLASLRYLVPSDIKPFAGALLDLVGIPAAARISYAHWEEIITADEALLPTGLRYHNRFASCFADATAFWLARLRQNAGQTAPDASRARLFLSRATAPQERVLRNRAAITALAERNGLSVVIPEQMGIEEQAALFSGAALLAGEYGSALHNSVFMAPGTGVLALRGAFRHPDFVQTGIAAALKQEVAYVFGASEGSDAAYQFSIDPAAFERALAAMA